MNLPMIRSLVVLATLAAVTGCETPQPRTPPPPPPYAVLPPSPADIKALVKAGLSNEVIISQIRNSRVIYRLSSAEIIDLKESGVSEQVIDFMINTANLYGHSYSAPPRD